MNHQIQGRTSADGVALRGLRNGTFWMISLFVLIGLSLGLGLLFASESTGFGYETVSVILVLFPLVVFLVIKAIPQAWDKVRQLRQAWTWWHWLWFLMFFSMLVFRVRGVKDLSANPLDPAGLLRVLAEGSVVLALLVRLVLKKPFWLKDMYRGVVGAMGVYALVCIISTLWAYTAWWTAYRSVEFFFDVALISAIVAAARSWDTYEKLLNWTLSFYGIGLVTVWIGVAFWPADAFDGGRLQGVFPVEASNSVGSAGATLAIIALCRLFPLSGRIKDGAWYIVLGLFGVVSLVLSQTRNVEASLVVAVLVVTMLIPRLRKFTLTAGALLAPLAAILFFMYSDNWRSLGEKFVTYINRDQAAGAIATMSGRTEWWAYGFKLLRAHPLTGIGAYGGRFAVLDKLGVGSAAMMHSDWVEISIGTSFWGLIPFIVALGLVWYYLLKSLFDQHVDIAQRQLSLEMIGILAMLTLHSFFNNELGWHIPVLYFTMLGFAECIRRMYRSQSHHRWVDVTTPLD